MRRPVSRLALCSLLALIAVAGVACAARGPVTPAASRAAVAGELLQPDSIIVRVANRFGRALTIYLVRAGVESRLGEVGAGVESRFPLLAADVPATGIAFAVTPPASNESLRTARFAVRPGQVAWFEIAPKLVDSRVVIRWPPRCETCADPLHAPRPTRRPASD